jgi:acetyl esterase/lipase
MAIPAAPKEPQSHVYKISDGCHVKADVFGAAAGARKPVVMWIHGGGLIFGTRAWQRATLFATLLQAGLIVVAIDHRLAPETKLADIADDVGDAWRWVVERGPVLFGADPDRLAIGGASAGAYLSLMSGYRVQPRPRAIVSFWGYGDITTPWESEPSEHYRTTLPLVSREEALQVVGTSAISEPVPGVDRSVFYLYCRQQGRWPIEVTGHEPRAEPGWFDPYCPIRNVTAQFPPVMLIHGTVDTDVPYEESKNMAARLAAASVLVEFLTLDGIGHGFAGAAPEVAAACEMRAAEFLLAHVQGK